MREAEEMSEFTKWVSCWGNATSIIDQTATTYSKNLTLRYPVFMVFSGSRLRFRFSNLTGTEPVMIKANVARTGKSVGETTDVVHTICNEIDPETSRDITVDGKLSFEIAPGCEVVSDEISFAVVAGESVCVSMYLEGYTQMNAGVLITGPLSKGFFAYGDYQHSKELPMDLTRSTNWFYFLNTIDVYTEDHNKAIVCFGDSITAQDWPDYLSLLLWENGRRDTAVIRRAVSGTRILRQYDCITYAAYGLKGETRFPIEINVSGADSVILQHGINDIIHPVGTNVNPFRPMSDFPTAKEMEDGVTKLYIEHARKLGLKVYGGTLLPILGWRTYADFREELKNTYNDWLRTTELLDGCVDFDKAVRDLKDPRKFAEGYDSGDHLHPSVKAYKRMAEEVAKMIIFDVS